MSASSSFALENRSMMESMVDSWDWDWLFLDALEVLPFVRLPPVRVMLDRLLFGDNILVCRIRWDCRSRRRILNRGTGDI